MKTTSMEPTDKPSLTAMLLFSKVPASLHQEPKKKSGNPKPNNQNANNAKSKQCQDRYFAAMGTGWVGTTQLEQRMGCTQGTALPTLTKWLGKGLVERRPFGGTAYNRSKGWEWRVK